MPEPNEFGPVSGVAVKVRPLTVNGLTVVNTPLSLGGGILVLSVTPEALTTVAALNTAKSFV